MIDDDPDIRYQVRVEELDQTAAWTLTPRKEHG